jgi:alpha-amylase/alpha-mannosidase (GH57 family)
MKQNFNFVPSLLEQLVDYEDLDVKDTYLDVFRKDPSDLTEEDWVFSSAIFSMPTGRI